MFNEDRLRPYLQTLDAIAETIPHGMIGGGFLRDTLLGKPTKDIDLFVSQQPTKRELSMLGVILAGDADALHLEHVADSDYPVDRMLALWRGRAPRFGLEQVDLCLVNRGVDGNLREFPENISRVWYDTRGLHMMPEFVTGHAKRVIVTRLPESYRRTQRIMAKYPDYRVEVEADTFA